MMRLLREALHTAVAASLLACTTPKAAPPVGAAERRVLNESQAVLAVQEALVRAGALAERDYPLTLEGQPFVADVHFAKPPFAIEWVSGDDRQQLGARLPRATPTSPLQIVSAAGPDGTVQVLVLDAETYPYEGNPLRVQRGAADIEEAERKLRGDVQDFLDYVRDQGGSL